MPEDIELNSLRRLIKHQLSNPKSLNAIKLINSGINNTNALEIDYPPVYLSEKEALRLIRVKPVKDKKELGLEFPLPFDLYQYYDSKPMSILGSLMGHEGNGSLL